MTGRIILAGGSGFLGRTLARHFVAAGRDVVILSRRSQVVDGARTVVWDGRTPGGWCAELEGAAAVVNLAGRSVNCRYTPANRRAILASRVDATRVLGAVVGASERAPRVWLNAGTATIYRHHFGEPWDEQGEIGATPAARDAFSVEVARAWERACVEAETPSTRKLILRIAMVFGTQPGGVYEVLRRLTHRGLGGAMAGGRQFVSWLHAVDFCRAVAWLIDRPAAEGIYNLGAPQPVTNAEMMATLRRQLGVRVGLPAPRWMLAVGAWLLRTETELMIKSRNVAPGRLLREGFEFEFPEFAAAVAALESDTGSVR